MDNINDFIVPVLTYPDERLHKECADIIEFGPEIEHLGRTLLYTMKAFKGIGLAGPQVGILKNIIAVWIEEKAPMVFVNPQIVSVSTEMFKFSEGCLSVPGYYEDRERPKVIKLKFKDVTGIEHEADFGDLYAFCIQHELDHLKGKVFIDDLSQLKKDRIKSKIKKSHR